MALNCGMGSSSLNADVNALERLQIVSGRKSSLLRLELEVVDGAGKMFGSFQSTLDEGFIYDYFRGDVG